MLSLQIGPLALPMGLALLIAALCIAYGVAWVLRRRHGLDAAPLIGDMLIAGLLAARLAFVLRWHEQYLDYPWTIVNIRDGGFMASAGLVAALLMAAWRCRRPAMAARRKPLALSVAAGALAWCAISGALALLNPASASLPVASLHNLDGRATSLAALAAGKPLVVNLWASWCPPCRREMPVLFAAQQARPDIVFVYANQREDGVAVRHFLDQGALALRNVVLDTHGELGLAAGSSALPTTLFYDAQGRLRATHLGELSHASLAAKLLQISAPAP